jgi:hypothetical protein
MFPDCVISSSESVEKLAGVWTNPDKVSRSKRATNTFLLVVAAIFSLKAPIFGRLRDLFSWIPFQTILKVLYHWLDERVSRRFRPGKVISRLLSRGKGTFG